MDTFGGEHKAWRRVLDSVEMTELRERIEKAGGNAVGDVDEHRTHTLQRLRDLAKRMKSIRTAYDSMTSASMT